MEGTVDWVVPQAVQLTLLSQLEIGKTNWEKREALAMKVKEPLPMFQHLFQCKEPSAAAYLLTSANAAGEKMRNGVRFISIFSTFLDIFINAMKSASGGPFSSAPDRWIMTLHLSAGGGQPPLWQRKKRENLSTVRISDFQFVADNDFIDAPQTVSFPLQQAKSFEKNSTQIHQRTSVISRPSHRIMN